MTRHDEENLHSTLQRPISSLGYWCLQVTSLDQSGKDSNRRGPRPVGCTRTLRPVGWNRLGVLVDTRCWGQWLHTKQSLAEPAEAAGGSITANRVNRPLSLCCALSSRKEGRSISLCNSLYKIRRQEDDDNDKTDERYLLTVVVVVAKGVAGGGWKRDIERETQRERKRETSAKSNSAW